MTAHPAPTPLPETPGTKIRRLLIELRPPVLGKLPVIRPENGVGLVPPALVIRTQAQRQKPDPWAVPTRKGTARGPPALPSGHVTALSPRATQVGT